MATIQIELNGAGRIRVQFLYDPTHIQKIRSIHRWRWHPEAKVWSMPHKPGTVERLLALFAGEELAIDPSPRGDAPLPSNPTPLKQSVVTTRSILQWLGEELQLRGTAPGRARSIKVKFSDS